MGWLGGGKRTGILAAVDFSFHRLTLVGGAQVHGHDVLKAWRRSQDIVEVGLEVITDVSRCLYEGPVLLVLLYVLQVRVEGVLALVQVN
jgi:hypothetical protein